MTKPKVESKPDQSILPITVKILLITAQQADGAMPENIRLFIRRGRSTGRPKKSLDITVRKI